MAPSSKHGIGDRWAGDANAIDDGEQYFQAVEMSDAPAGAVDSMDGGLQNLEEITKKSRDHMIGVVADAASGASSSAAASGASSLAAASGLGFVVGRSLRFTKEVRSWTDEDGNATPLVCSQFSSHHFQQEVEGTRSRAHSGAVSS